MAEHIFYCEPCKSFTMKKTCTCGKKTIPPQPAKYSPEDKYASYRRKAKKPQILEKGLL